jgi:hypothetical protein
MIAVRSEIREKYTNAVCGHNGQSVNVKLGGTYGNQTIQIM